MHPRTSRQANTGIRLAIATACLATSLATAGSTQQLSVAAGFGRVPERVGDDGSDHGFASRLALYVGARRPVSFGLELGFDRFNTDVRQGGPQSCLLPGGATGDCFFRSENRDDGLSIAALARLQARGPGASPYAVIGLGVLSTRNRKREEVTDAAGNHLPNFEFDGTFEDTNLMAHLGAGVAIPVGGSAVAITLEGRLTPVLYNYSGAPAISLGHSMVAGIRLGR